MSAELFIISFKSVCGKRSVDSKSEVILDVKLFGGLLNMEFLTFLILNFLVPLLRSALHYLFT